jgi:hypothetical protein
MDLYLQPLPTHTWTEARNGAQERTTGCNTPFLFGREQPRRCVFCHDDIPSVLTKAHHHHKRVREANRHRPGIDHTDDLCWSCHHGLLHAGIISIKEVRAAAAATIAGTRKVTHDEVYWLIKADLAAGGRKPDWRALHGLSAALRAEHKACIAVYNSRVRSRNGRGTSQD